VKLDLGAAWGDGEEPISGVAVGCVTATVVVTVAAAPAEPSGTTAAKNSASDRRSTASAASPFAVVQICSRPT